MTRKAAAEAPQPKPAAAEAPAPLRPSLEEIADVTRDAMNPILGTIDEKVKVFGEISANAAASTIALNGWDTAAKCKFACWIADGMRVHPAVYMAGNWLMAGKNGRLVIEPKWEFVIEMLEARVRGFQWKVEEETNERCVVWMTNGRSEHRVHYGREDAQRQGLFDKKGETYPHNEREMYFKQATKRCGKRIGGIALRGMAEGEVEIIPGAEQPAAPDPAIALARAAGTTPAPEPTNWVKELAGWISDLYGAELPKEQKLAHLSIIESQRSGAKVSFNRVDEIGPVQAKIICEWLAKKHPDRKLRPADNGDGSAGNPAGAGGGMGPATSAGPSAAGGAANSSAAGGTDAPPADFGEQHAAEHETPPPMEEPSTPVPEEPVDLEEQGRLAREAQDRKLETLLTLVRVAKKSHPGRNFVKESPTGSGKNWFVDSAILKNLGYKEPLRLDPDAGTLSKRIEGSFEYEVAEPDCARVVRAMREAGVADTTGISR